MRKKPIVLGLLTSVTGLAVLGTVGAQSPPPGMGTRMPASPTYGAGATQPPLRAGTVPPAAPSYTRQWSDWTPTPPAAGYQPPMPQNYNAGRPQPQQNPAMPPAGAGLGTTMTQAQPLPTPMRPLNPPAPSTGIRTASVDLPPPNMDLTSGGVRPAGGPLPMPAFPAPTGMGSTTMPSLPSPSGMPSIPAPDPRVTTSKFPTLPAPDIKLPEPLVNDVKAMPSPSVPSLVMPSPTPLVSGAPTMFSPAPAMPVMAPVGNGNTVLASPSPMETFSASPTAPMMATKVPAETTAVTPGSLPARLAPSVIVEAFAPETVNFGQEFKYDLLVRNAGAVGIADVKVSDELPMGARFLSSDPPAEVNGDHLMWSLGGIEPGADRRISVRIKPSDEGELRSRATVSFSASVDAKTRVTRPRISVAVAGPETARVGEEAAFVIKVTNTGSGPATKLMLKAMLTDGLFCPKVPSAGGNEIETILADVKPGETKSIKLPVAAARAGMQSCQIVAATEGSPESTARVAVNVVEALLQLKQTGPAHCFVRSEPTYSIDLANPGTASTDPLSVYSVLPDGFEYVQASDGGVFNSTTRAVTWRLPSLPAGGTRQVTLKVRSVSAADGMLRTLAQCGQEQAPASGVVTASAITGGRALEAKAETPIHAEGVSAIRFEVAGVEGLVEVGKEAVYEIRVSNQGTGACSNVQLVAALAEGTSYTGSNGPTQIKAQGQQLVFDAIPTLGVKGELVYRVRVRGTVAGDQRLRVQLTCDQITSPVVKEESTRFYQQ